MISDEVLQLIFYELTDPSHLTQVSKRFHRFSQDPYVRAHYFLAHYGSIEAVYHALGRGKLVTERVLDACHLPLFFGPCVCLTFPPFPIHFLDPPNKWGPPLSISHPDCHTPLLPYSSPFHQDSMGSKCSIARLCLLPDPFGGEIRGNSEGQGKLNTIYAGLTAFLMLPVVQG